ncbi:hypothetical protein AYI69_g5510 [Smittium culicis]|uniref:Uncharacterized protein n=1 Tax=Smittium culicis TaxID=133412 RepID=A0A1R1Y5P7_9FUNG|nr:hypothetical protein AYI69_g5510 [Smittium culicis]
MCQSYTLSTPSISVNSTSTDNASVASITELVTTSNDTPHTFKRTTRAKSTNFTTTKYSEPPIFVTSSAVIASTISPSDTVVTTVYIVRSNTTPSITVTQRPIPTTQEKGYNVPSSTKKEASTIDVVKPYNHNGITQDRNMNNNDKRSTPTVTKEIVGNDHGNPISKKTLTKSNPKDSGEISITQSKSNIEFDINDLVKSQEVKRSVADNNEKQTPGKKNIDIMF